MDIKKINIEPNRHYPEFDHLFGLNPFNPTPIPSPRKQMFVSTSTAQAKREEEEAKALEAFSAIKSFEGIAQEVFPVEYETAHAPLKNMMGARAVIRLGDVQSEDPDSSVFARINGWRNITELSTPYRLVRYMRELAKIREVSNYDNIDMPKVKDLWNTDVYHLDYFVHKDQDIPTHLMVSDLIQHGSQIIVDRKLADSTSYTWTEAHQLRWDKWMKAMDLYLACFRHVDGRR